MITREQYLIKEIAALKEVYINAFHLMQQYKEELEEIQKESSLNKFGIGRVICKRNFINRKGEIEYLVFNKNFDCMKITEEEYNKLDVVDLIIK